MLCTHPEYGPDPRQVSKHLWSTTPVDDVAVLRAAHGAADAHQAVLLRAHGSTVGCSRTGERSCPIRVRLAFENSLSNH